MHFGRYELISRLAVGGMGEVFRARVTGAEGFEKAIALKRIFPHLSEDERYRRLFVREAKVTARLVHPNIVQVHELGETDGQFFIAMEFVSGADFRAVIRHSQPTPISMDTAAVVAFDALEALDFAHNLVDEDGASLGLVHRDISPSNILIDKFHGLAKVCDFGVARLLDSDGATDYLDGHAVGKLGYMAPEQLWAGVSDARSDLWSLAVILFEAMTGDRFMPTRKAAAVAEFFEAGALPRLAAARPDLPKEFTAAVDKVLQIEPDARIQTASEFREVIENLLAGSDPRGARRELRDMVRQLEPTVVDFRVPGGEPSGQSWDGGTERWTHLLSAAQARETGEMSAGSPDRQTEAAAEIGVMEDTRLSDRHDLPLVAASLGQVITDVKLDPHDEIEFSEAEKSETRVAESPFQTTNVPMRVASVVERRRRAFLAVTGLLGVVLFIAWGVSRSDDEARVKREASEVPPVLQGVGAPDSRDGADRRSRASQRRRRKRDGALSVTAKPAARVTIDGVAMNRPTPIRNYRVQAGNHTIVLRWPGGKSKTLRVSVLAGKTLTKHVTMD